MTKNLCAAIGDDRAVKTGGFAGAVFLTYTLNLTFYEQVIAPRLDQAGCSNVLIIADPDGYQGAMDMGLQSISGAGLRYVCVPLPRPGWGVQHAKVMLMAGAKRGRLMIGSGNLTLHGFGRNLELFSHFEYDVERDVEEKRYPFSRVWYLVENLAIANDLSDSARNQIQSLRLAAPWLEAAPIVPWDFRVWHNYDLPILEQLLAWRAERNLAGQPIRRIRVITPYFDPDAGVLASLVSNLLPDDIQIYLDPELTNLDGSVAAQNWRTLGTQISVNGIGAGDETKQRRHVHAKAIIGYETDGAWCITGSANLTRPALLKTWSGGSNLELVTFQWANDPTAFDYLFNDSHIIRIWPLSLDQISITEPEPSEQTVRTEASFTLVDLSISGNQLYGRLSASLPGQAQIAAIHLLHSNTMLPIQVVNGLSFHCNLPTPLSGTEAARVESDGLVTPYRWIDQPDLLARFGARSYQGRIKSKIETIAGAEQLFQELMNYLWERVEPGEVDEQDPNRIRKTPGKHADGKDEPQGPVPTEDDVFVIDEEELVQKLQWATNHHQPYDRHLFSLRDLLSLVLLRLTTVTQPTADSTDGEIRDDEVDQNLQTEQNAQRVKVLERLRAYLIAYCKRYGRRLVDPDFIRRLHPSVIFQNHFTLSRVLLEFAANREGEEMVFTHQDLRLCMWWIWAPLVWPEIIGLDGVPTLKLLANQHTQAQVLEAWQDTGMVEAGIVIFCESLGKPPNWRAGLRDSTISQVFMVAREWIRRVTNIVSEAAFRLDSKRLNDALGIRSIRDIIGELEQEQVDYYIEGFAQIENYIPPLQEKYLPLIRLAEQSKSSTQVSQELIDVIKQQGLLSEYEAFQHQPVPIVPTNEGEPYCPRCGAHQTGVAQGILKQGKLALCTTSRDAWIYFQPKLPKTVV